MVSYLVDLVRSHLMLRRVRRYVHKRQKYLEDRQHNEHFWENNQSIWSKIWLRWKCLQNALLWMILRSLFGFIGGVVLVLVLLLSLSVQVQMSPVKVAVLMSVLSPLLTLGLAFSSQVRCVVLLLLPQLASKRGRHALVAFAFILAINGPAANTIHNMHETAHSLTCTLKLAGIGFRKLANIVERPLETAKMMIDKALTTIKLSVSELRSTLVGFQKAISAIGNMFKASLNWLTNVKEMCDQEFGTPMERCIRLIEKSSKECSDSFGPNFSWLCSVSYAGSLTCSTLSSTTAVCVAANPFAEAVDNTVKEMRDDFMKEIDAIFYVDVHFEQDFTSDFETDNKTLRSMLQEMKAELEQIYYPFVFLYKLAGGLLGLTWIIIFYKAFKYHMKFKTNDRFDNYYVTREMREIDLARIKQGKEPILPLTSSEKRLYCRPGKLRLLRSERKRLFHSLVFLFLATLNIIYYLGCDYSLFWVLDVIKRDTILPDTPPERPQVKLQVGGEGLIPDMYRNLSESFSSHKDMSFDLHPSMCLPRPKQPDMVLYLRIGSVLLLAWFFALLEPFVLRLRPHVLSLYYPERARARATWLSSHILRERGGFFRDIGRLAGVMKNAEPLTKRGLVEKLKDRFWLARLFFGGAVQSCCVVCATAADKFLECEALGCNAIYCEECFHERRNVCIVCEENLVQPEIPGLILERYSGDEEVEKEESETTRAEASTSSKPHQEAEEDEPRLNFALNFMTAILDSMRDLLFLVPRWPL
ncbi:Hypothetical predicted protein [Cloeon dipterum]|uniref:Dendritic cell-specific transmembrane protein-like domain-containing protein n=1 Tax=Cloeon dipterum TaxID=197152 RepID=A0A8S1C9V1_9INSE|nr:Hypothetical predicted protein [Cloeon dipterum]